MSESDLYHLIGDYEYAVDVVERPDGGLKVITNWDLALYRKGIIPNPYLV